VTEEGRGQAFLSLKNVQHASRSASTIALCGITFFYEQTLKREWTTLTFVRPPQEYTLPVILSPTEVHTLLQGVQLPRYRTCLTPIYACGLRLQEGTHLQIPDIDSARLLIQTPPRHPLRQCIIKLTGYSRETSSLGSAPVLPYARPLYYLG
jgi:site-specific recombinase XerD